MKLLLGSEYSLQGSAFLTLGINSKDNKLYLTNITDFTNKATSYDIAQAFYQVLPNHRYMMSDITGETTGIKCYYASTNALLVEGFKEAIRRYSIDTATLSNADIQIYQLSGSFPRSSRFYNLQEDLPSNSIPVSLVRECLLSELIVIARSDLQDTVKELISEIQVLITTELEGEMSPVLKAFARAIYPWCVSNQVFDLNGEFTELQKHLPLQYLPRSLNN